MLRAIEVAIPAGAVIWIFSNLSINGMSILNYIINFLDPFAKLMGLDGYILVAFIFGMPANEIVLPVILMSYLGNSTLNSISDYTTISDILTKNNWTIITAINTMIFTILHFPCTTTLISIFKETKKFKWTFLSFILPTICGIIICIINNYALKFVFKIL